MRCDTCKHWETKRENYESISDDIRVCFKAKELWDCTEWVEEGSEEYNSHYERKLKKEFVDQKSFVQDGSSYSARLLTKADFFCAHFEGLNF